VAAKIVLAQMVAMMMLRLFMTDSPYRSA